MLSIRIPPRLCSNNVFRKFLQCGFREQIEANYWEYTNFWVEHSARQNWVQLGPALGKSHFSNFVRPQFCGIPACLAHTHHTCPSKRPGQTLAYPRRLQKLNKSSPFDKVLSNAFLPSDPCHCPCLFFRSRIAECSLLMDACQRQRIPPRLVLLFRFACSQKLAYPRQLTLNAVSEKLIAEGIQRSGTKKGHFLSYTSKKTIDL